MLVILSAFLLVPLFTGPLFYVQPPPGSSVKALGSVDGTINSALVSDEDGGDDDEKFLQPHVDDQNSDLEEFTLIETLMTLDCWLLFFIFFGIIGAGITLVNNFAELVFSLVDVDHSIVVRIAL
jgi:hypothetical protein